jgi:hypothetical protein
MEISGKTMSNVTEVIDGNHYRDCRFENCELVYTGGDIPHITGCQFDNCSWHFDGAAERTLLFMRQMYHGMGAGGVQLIEGTLNALRQPISQDPRPPASPPVAQ